MTCFATPAFQAAASAFSVAKANASSRVAAAATIAAACVDRWRNCRRVVCCIVFLLQLGGWGRAERAPSSASAGIDGYFIQSYAIRSGINVYWPFAGGIAIARPQAPGHKHSTVWAR